MAAGNFVAYYRVSTDRQGKSGLGLEAQQKAVEDYLNGGSWRLVASFTEVESGRNNGRPELTKALAACRVHNATLVIAKLDRLSRNARFLLELQEAGVRFVAVDMPHADNFTVGVLALVAQKEAEMISQRTKAALSAARARGVKLGGDRGNLTSQERSRGTAASVEVRNVKADSRARDLAPILNDLKGQSYARMAEALNERGIRSPRGSHWSAMSVRREVLRAGLLSVT
ncbi:MAG: recombinase family protein [Methylocystis sp.]|jgi:DNA invertase Pin-like site-specific DNA recombinase